VKALVWLGGREFRVEDLPEPKALRGQIAVKVEAAAICGSDFHMADFGVRPPLVLGHEIAGTVLQIGEGVAGCSVGERVALDPVQRCGRCWCCTHGMEHLCTDVRHLGWGETPGGWAEYVAVDAANAHPVPPGIRPAAAALTEPAAVCWESFQRARLAKGDRVLIIGDGPFGFLHAQLARSLGADKIIIAGHHDRRLARIAARTQAVTCNTLHEHLPDVLDSQAAEHGIDIVIDACGSGSSLPTGINALRPRGTLVLFSAIWKPEPLDTGAIQARELNVLGSSRSLNAYRPCLDLMDRGKLDTAALIDVEVPLAEFPKAIQALATSKGEMFKAVLLPQE
jgi:threonine dehydrogenase-like Zn-dependent dehydrogenase